MDIKVFNKKGGIFLKLFVVLIMITLFLVVIFNAYSFMTQQENNLENKGILYSFGNGTLWIMMTIAIAAIIALGIAEKKNSKNKKKGKHK